MMELGGKCTASVRACPKGGNDVHMNFSSIQEMNDHNQGDVDKQGSKSHGLLPSVGKVNLPIGKFEVHKIFISFAM